MFIDIHAHAYRKPVPFVVQFCTAEELIQRYDELGIEKGVLLPVVSPEIYFPQANEDILDMAEKYPDRFIPYCNIDPRALTNSAEAPLDRVLSYYKEKGCKGLGEVMLNAPLMDPLVQNLFRHAERVGLPVVFDGSDQKTGDFGLYDDPGLPQLEHTLQRFPNLSIFGHGPVFWAEIGRLETPGERAIIFDLNGDQVGRLPSGPIKEEGVVPILFRRYPNLFGDLSDGTAFNAIARDPEYGPKFLTEFQDRLYFGTDICTKDMPVPLVELLIDWRDTQKISETVFKKISRENAAKLLGLKYDETVYS
ncbi:amidohydrolase family protein [Paenibacillus sp. MBLB4367]|uniref:amidohydrolase family protein n=1 Tax=Paenibacillus sp. MBLB4367 TaxID=3384767 RepID=UPI003907EBDF